jgi:folylpolyglutamate synthase
MNVLGHTLPEIAREKAGIFKRGVPAFSCSQRDDAAQTLVGVASDVSTPLAFVSPSTSLLRLGIGGAHQFTNAAVAVSLATAFLARTGRSRLLLPSLSHVAEFATRGSQHNVSLSVGISTATLPAAFVRGLERCQWPGRSQIVVDPRNDAIRYAIDGAHTVESMEVAGAWFGAQRRVKSGTAYVLLFNCANTKQPEKLLSCVASSVGVEFDAVIFTTYRTDPRNGLNRERGETAWPANTPADVDQTLPNLAFQQQLADCYRTLRPNVEISCVHSVREAIDRIAQLSERTRRPVDVLATGSLYLAGAMLEALEVDTRNL